MSVLKAEIEKTTFGIIVGNRDVFPDHLAKEGRVEILELMAEMGYDHVILAENDTKFGVVETYQDAKKCAELFKQHRESIKGIIVVLPNFGDEKGIATTIKLANLNVPILVHASSDEVEKMSRATRRDAFCGKISVTSVLYQHGIPFSLTNTHTCAIKSDSFKKDIQRFEKICRIVNKLKNLRLGQIGTRPNAFETVRYSEKILEFNGISIEPIDLSEIIAAIDQLKDDNANVKGKMEYLKSYTSSIEGVPEDGIVKLAKLAVVIEDWVKEKELDGFAFQCWPSIQDNFGVAPCAVLSIFSENMIPGACEVDISGLIGMFILQLASETPSSILDWNNNYGDDPDKMVLFHCSNLPKSFFQDTRLTDHPIISDDKPELAYGAIQGRIKTTPCTLLRVETDDVAGEVKAMLAEGNYTDDPLDTFGGYGVIEIPELQFLLKKLCYGGFAHHVAASLDETADIIYEALFNYLGWNVDFHNLNI